MNKLNNISEISDTNDNKVNNLNLYRSRSCSPVSLSFDLDETAVCTFYQFVFIYEKNNELIKI